MDEKPNTAEFVRGIEQSINLEKIKSDSKAKTEKTDTDYQAAAQYLSDPNAGAEPEAPEQKKPGKGFNIQRYRRWRVLPARGQLWAQAFCGAAAGLRSVHAGTTGCFPVRARPPAAW